ncbi:hypothetical protein BBAD15_g1586 [Beauveria bassiana D1-5]|uniref:Uncharacterized protein n=1 Tax=Beauveria bassiana D1-5 TaxID=1245745 RepID=A0A0A2VXT2_BEABA|nr:hypothetical protein BBAD15_g1586 [Beauveria bassiana D1-5]
MSARILVVALHGCVTIGPAIGPWVMEGKVDSTRHKMESYLGAATQRPRGCFAIEQMGRGAVPLRYEELDAAQHLQAKISRLSHHRCSVKLEMGKLSCMGGVLAQNLSRTFAPPPCGRNCIMGWDGDRRARKAIGAAGTP